MRQSFIRVVAVAAALVLSVSSFAYAETSAEGFVKEKHDELVTLVKKKSEDKRIEKAFDAMLDYEELARASLRENWAARSEAERQEFQAVLKELVQRAYRKNLAKTVNYQVKYFGEKKQDTGFMVKTIASSKTNAREEPVEIQYLVRRVDGQWRVHDIVTEGSSLVNNYHRQFLRIIKKDGFDELMRKMKKKLAEG